MGATDTTTLPDFAPIPFWAAPKGYLDETARTAAAPAIEKDTGSQPLGGSIADRAQTLI
jgi:hypothetical protein